MPNLKSPISSVPKIGPKYKDLLKNLDIFTVEDLLYHIPFRYEDLSSVKNIRDLIEGETVTIHATINSIANIFTKNGKRLTKATLFDFTGKVDVIWFNQHFLKRIIKTGKSYTISGKVGLFNNKLCLLSPNIEETKEESLNTGRVVSVYPETLGVTSRWIRSRINDILNENLLNEDYLPEIVKSKLNLKDLDWAIQTIHFPDNLSLVEDARRRLAFDEFFLELLNVESRKNEWSGKTKGYKFKEYKQLETFLKTLPFELTDSQINAIQEVVKDTQKETPMNRLLEGDVGTGKTVVAIASAYFTHLNGFKTLYLAPTEILAQQHYQTFTKFLEKANLKIGLITGSKKTNHEDFDILIGTHAILFKNTQVDNIGLIVIDEQHRFGVEQRGKIVEMSKSSKTPHLLTMTATPIPRTLALTLYGDLSISTLKTHPKTERKVTTKVLPEQKREEVYRFILQKNQPTFIVCPLIEESESESLGNVKAAEKEYENLKQGVFANVPMGLIHGRMKPQEKEDVVKDFREGKIKVLVATPVIEVGIDIPDATVMIIESGERYGLASLHQLRGRVGRGGDEAHCFIFMSNFSKNAYERLKNLEQISNGLSLAEIDMKNRGQGDIFSTMQHGFKKFKVADFSNIVLLEEAKISAQETFPQLSKYPKLEEKLKDLGNQLVKNN